MTDKSWLEQIGDMFSGDPQNREQLIEVLREAMRRGLLASETLSMIESTMQLSEMQVRDIMVPRNDMIFLKSNGSLPQFLQIAIESGSSRFPLFDDEEQQVLGLIFAKDLLALSGQQGDVVFQPKEMMRAVMFVPESQRLDVLLREFKATHQHMALVVDEYGNVSGLVTIEDVLEQIVGEIEDEHDVEEAEDNIKEHKNGRYIVKALTPLEDFNHYFQCALVDDELDTIGGLVLKHFSCLPKRGDVIEIDGFKITVIHADNRRLRLVEVVKCH
jgi:magnesium and cobalt transporter